MGCSEDYKLGLTEIKPMNRPQTARPSPNKNTIQSKINPRPHTAKDIQRRVSFSDDIHIHPIKVPQKTNVYKSMEEYKIPPNPAPVISQLVPFLTCCLIAKERVDI